MPETPPKISRALHAFLVDWLAWVERGAPDGKPYDRWAGLCHASKRFDEAIYTELNDLFCGEPYPFGGSKKYFAARWDGTQHLNPARLTWVRQTIATAEIEG